MSVCVHRGQKRKLDMLELRVTDSCELLYMGARNQTWVDTFNHRKETTGVQIYTAQSLSSLPGTGYKQKSLCP